MRHVNTLKPPFTGEDLQRRLRIVEAEHGRDGLIVEFREGAARFYVGDPDV